jgi:excisionase family DNA binding protein
MTDYIKPNEAAQMLGVSRESIRRYVDAGLIDAIKTPGGQRRIDRASVQDVIAARRPISSTVTIIEAV